MAYLDRNLYPNQFVWSEHHCLGSDEDVDHGRGIDGMIVKKATNFVIFDDVRVKFIEKGTNTMTLLESCKNWLIGSCMNIITAGLPKKELNEKQGLAEWSLA